MNWVAIGTAAVQIRNNTPGSCSHARWSIDGLEPVSDVKRVGDVFGGKYASSSGT